VAVLAARNASVIVMAPVVGSDGVCVWRESGVKWSVLCWCVWQESGFSRREDVVTFNLLKKRDFINFVLSMRFGKIILQ
jgi:hypothetical protein